MHRVALSSMSMGLGQDPNPSGGAPTSFIHFNKRAISLQSKELKRLNNINNPNTNSSLEGGTTLDNFEEGSKPKTSKNKKVKLIEIDQNGVRRNIRTASNATKSRDMRPSADASKKSMA